MSKKVVVVGADHNGVILKNKLKELLFFSDFHCIDIGPFSTVPSVDYPDFAYKVARLVGNKEADLGILICGTGIGMSIAANKHRNVRASLVHNMLSAKKSREHNDANVLCLGSWINDDETNLALATTWLAEPFGQGRHIDRVEKIELVEFTN